MNINPNVTRILCYGDSNTWGENPSAAGRYPADVRWTGRLQTLLGDNYEIIEEGLCGRTTVFDRAERPGRNGKIYLLPCVKTHSPFDVIIISLGTNDFKDALLTAEDVARGNEELVKIVREYAWNKDQETPKIILACPPIIDGSVPYAIEKGLTSAEEKLKRLPAELKKIAEKYGAAFINLQQYVKPSQEDGCHLSSESHKMIAEVLFEKIKALDL